MGKRRVGKKFVSVFMSVVLVVGLMPLPAYADEGGVSAASDRQDGSQPALAVGAFGASDLTTQAVDSSCVPGDDLNGVKVRFRPAGSHKPVAVEDDGDGDQKDLILYYLGESTHFRLVKADADSYKIYFFNDFAKQDVKKDKAHVLDVERNDNDNSTYFRDGQNIHMVSGDSDVDNKKWQFIQQDDGTYYIRNKLSQKYWSLKDPNKPKTNDNEIVQSSTPMKWELELVSTSDFSVSKLQSIKHYDSLNFTLGGQTVTSLNWMSHLPDSAYITDISIPGTHDAATARLKTSEDKESRRTQQYYIDEMLAAGVRHFDTRIGWDDNKLVLVHSDDAVALDHNGSKLELAKMMQWTIDFLKANPGETVVMQIMADEEVDKVEHAALLYFNDFVRTNANKDMIWVGDHVPTLSEVRGKIVIISRFNKVTLPDSKDFYVSERGGYWALDVAGWRQSETYPYYQSNDRKFLINSSAQPDNTADKWDDCEVWVQDSYSHTPHDTAFKNSKKPYIVGSIDGIVYDYFGLPEAFAGAKAYPEGTYGAEYRRAEALKNGKHAWVFNYTNCSANGLGYHYRGNAKEIHQWIYDNDWIIRDDMFTGVVGNDYEDELLASKIYRTNFAGGTGGWSNVTYEWSADNATCTASRTWTGGVGFTETETATASQTSVSATCTVSGSVSYEATFQNSAFKTQVKKVKGDPALGHSWDAGEITRAPTCTRDGEKTFKCAHDASHTRTEAVPATEHTPAEPVRENEVAATSETPGHYDSVTYCKTCGKKLFSQRVEIPIAECHHENREWVDQVVTTADCTHSGYHYSIYQCSDCGEMLTHRLVRDQSALGHSWGDATYTWADGHSTLTATHTCSRCNVTESETVEPTVTTQAPTCTTGGATVYVATFKDASFGVFGVVTDAVTIDPLGHSWDSGIVTKKRTCDEDGVKTYTCRRCGETRTEALPAIGHSPSEPAIENEVAATCTSEGSYDEVVHCMACDEELSRETKSIPLDPNAHEWDVQEGCDADGWRASTVGSTVTETRTCKYDPSHIETRSYDTEHVHDYRIAAGQPATCNADGVREHDICAICGHVFIVNEAGSYEETTLAALTIPAAHKPGDVEREVEIDPTCIDEGGYDEVVYCKGCGDELSRNHVTTEALGHDWGETTYEWSNDLSTCTATRTCSRDESHAQTANATVTYDMTKAPTATEPGEATYTATFDADWAQAQTATEAVAPTGEEDAIAYHATKGGTAWEKGSGATLSFTFERSQNNPATFSHFTGVLVDGSKIAEDAYTARSGSVVIELLPDYLETLPAGTHKLQPTFDDGVGDAVSFVIEEASDSNADGGNAGEKDGKADGSGSDNAGSGGSDANASSSDKNANAKGAPATSKGSQASAKTGDAIPVAAVCVLLVAALAIALVARRKLKG